MSDVFYCVFWKNHVPNEDNVIIGGETSNELIGVFETRESAESVMDLIDAMHGDYLRFESEEHEYVHCFCKEYPRSRIRWEYLSAFNRAHQKES